MDDFISCTAAFFNYMICKVLFELKVSGKLSWNQEKDC